MRLLFAVLVILLAACQRGPSEADQREVARLEAVRDSVRRDLAALDSMPAPLRESLMGAMRQHHRGVLQTTDALLRQRIEALRAGATLTWTERAVRANPARADSLAREIRMQRDSLAAAEREAARYEPGTLFAAMAQTSVETRRVLLVTLDAARIMDAYGLAGPEAAVPR